MMKVVIVIPTHKSQPNDFECASFKQCLAVLGNYPIRVVCPAGTDMSYYDQFKSDTVQIIRVPKIWLSSIKAYNNFKTSRYFYQLFREFEYVLTYELDAYVFDDQLTEWCEAGFDYIGAPWFDGFSKPRSSTFSGVGNSGFSLRRVSSCLQALHSFSFIEKPSRVARRLVRNIGKCEWKAAGRDLRKLAVGNNTHYLMNDYDNHEDLFWGRIVPQRFEWFKVAPAEVAVRFSFEANPRYLYEANGHKLPFGCHAWAKLDLEFWRQFVTTDSQEDSVTCGSRN